MDFRRKVAEALVEDRAARDVTSIAFIPAAARGRARLAARQAGVLAGLEAAAWAFRLRDPRVRIRRKAADGARLAPGRVVLEAAGSLRALLSAERTAVNFVSHLSGISSLTRRFVAAGGPGGPAVLETRKTLPGLRDLQKYAVRVGGGRNHRRDLSDQILIKENHLAFFRGDPGRAALIRRVRALRRAGRVVEMEVRDRREALWALEAGADILLLDNVRDAALPGFVSWIRSRSLRTGTPALEVSGGVTLERMPTLARAGVDRVSVGRLTHSAPALDMALDVEAR